MSQRQSNPYEPPLSVDPIARKPSVLRLIGHASVFGYGVLFTLFCIAGTIDDIDIE